MGVELWNYINCIMVIITIYIKYLVQGLMGVVVTPRSGVFLHFVEDITILTLMGVYSMLKIGIR
jgi:hypothetical protein